MALPQQKFREIVFQLVYSNDFAKSQNDDMTVFMMGELEVSKKVMREALEKKDEIQSKQTQIDSLIAEVSKSYDFERISRIERNIIRLGVFEMLFSVSVPPKVAISEAIRLCRKFASPEGASFVNAILDALYKSHLPEGKSKDEQNDDSLASHAGQTAQ